MGPTRPAKSSVLCLQESLPCAYLARKVLLVEFRIHFFFSLCYVMISSLFRSLVGTNIARHDLNLYCDIFSRQGLQRSSFLSEADNASRQCLNYILDFTLSRNPSLIAVTQSQCLQELFAYTLLQGNIETYLEAGANNGILLSNTYGVMKTSGARGLLVEANPASLISLKQNRPADICVGYALSDKSGQRLEFNKNGNNTLFGRVLQSSSEKACDIAAGNSSSVSSITLPDVMAHSGYSSVDFMSLDIEGSESAALMGCTHIFWSFAMIEANSRSDAVSIVQALNSLGSKCYRYPFAQNEILSIADPSSCHSDLVGLLNSYFNL